MDSHNDDAVGYRRPPKKSQFKKGRSGNPKGRPKGSRNLSNLLEEELGQKVSLTENGRRVTMTKARLAARQQANNAAKGDWRAFEAIRRMQQLAEFHHGSGADQDSQPHCELSEEECLEALRQWFDKQGGD